MALWLRFAHQGSTGFGMVDKDTIQVCSGDLFAVAKPTGERLALDAVTILPPLPTDENARPVEQFFGTRRG